MKTSVKLLAPALVALFAATAAQAHHSGAMFDNTKTVTLVGTIKEFAWRNPHASVEVMVADAAGAVSQWSIECSTPNILLRKGWNIKSLLPGDKVTVVMHPMKDGGKAGLVMTVLTPSGTTLADHNF